MSYTLTQGMKDWLQELINLMPAGARRNLAQYWLDHYDTVTDDDLDALVNLYNNNQNLQSQAQAFATWVKGGVRPPHPH